MTSKHLYCNNNEHAAFVEQSRANVRQHHFTTFFKGLSANRVHKIAFVVQLTSFSIKSFAKYTTTSCSLPYKLFVMKDTPGEGQRTAISCREHLTVSSSSKKKSLTGLCIIHQFYAFTLRNLKSGITLEVEQAQQHLLVRASVTIFCQFYIERIALDHLFGCQMFCQL